jgi:hypothetical protein
MRGSYYGLFDEGLRAVENGVIRQWLIGESMEGKGYVLIDVVSKQLFAGTEESYENITCTIHQILTNWSRKSRWRQNFGQQNMLRPARW